LKDGRFKLLFSESALETDLEKGIQFVLKETIRPRWMSKPTGIKWGVTDFVNPSSFLD
jgi:hypothetical protein